MAHGSQRRKLRWYQFRLSTLLLVTLLVASGLVSWRVFVQPYRQQRAAIKTIQRLGAGYYTAATWQSRLFGNDFLRVTLVKLADCDRPQEYIAELADLSFLETLVVGGANFTDDHLNVLRRVKSLRALVLDSTSVSNAALADWQMRRGDVELYLSDRRALAVLENRRFGGGFTTAQADGYDDLAGRVGAEYFVEVRVVVAPQGRHARAVGDAFLADLNRLSHLAYLDLSDTSVTDAGMARLGQLRSLNKLLLRRTGIGDEGIGHLREVADLESLDLSWTRVSDDSVPHLEDHPTLRELWLIRTNMTFEGIDRLRKSLPGSRFHAGDE